MSLIAENLKRIQERIGLAADRADRDPALIRLVTVSKTFPAEKVREAALAGAAVFGENYVQEAKAKIKDLADLDPEWHFIGRLQTNKAKEVVKGFSLIHSVDRLKLAKELNKRAEAGISILIQVKLAAEETKGGVDEAGTLELLEAVAALEKIEVKGLMVIPPFFDQPERARSYFARLAALAEEARQRTGLALVELSMGMSGDFEVAVEEGATLVRVGSAIFGPRDYR